MFTSLINPLLMIMCISTATGVLVHDTRIDKAASTALALPSVMAEVDAGNKMAALAGDAHTHIERSSLRQAVHDLKGQTPSVQPRGNQEKKHLLQKYVTRGHHAFDNYNLPLV
jgi:uncharacterized membrane protein